MGGDATSRLVPLPLLLSLGHDNSKICYLWGSGGGAQCACQFGDIATLANIPWGERKMGDCLLMILGEVIWPLAI